MTTTTTLNKTAAGVLLAHTQIAATTGLTVGSAVDVSTKVGPATAFVKMGRTVATALSAAGVKFRLEGSAKTSGNDEWVPIYEWTTLNHATAASATTLNDAACNAGDTVFTLTSGTGFTVGDLIYLRETGTPANSEWVREKSISTNDVTVEEAITRSHTNGITVTDLAEMFAVPIDIAGLVRVRLVVEAPSVAVDVIAWIVTADSASTV